jgi:hypothetical protein
MATLHSLRVLPLSVSQSPVSRSHNVVKFAPMLAQETPFCRAHAGVGSSSSCVRNPRDVVRSVSGSAMREDEVEVEAEAASSGKGAHLVVVSFYKFANLPDYEQKRAPLKELCESHVRISLTL